MPAMFEFGPGWPRHGASLEHVIDRKHGGTYNRKNLAISHRRCNSNHSHISPLEKMRRSLPKGHPRARFMFRLLWSLTKTLCRLG